MRNLHFFSMIVTDRELVKTEVHQRIKQGWAVYRVFNDDILGHNIITFVTTTETIKEHKKIILIGYPVEFVEWIERIPLNEKIEKYSLYNVFFSSFQKVSSKRMNFWIKQYCAHNEMICIFKKSNNIERLELQKKS